MSSLLVTSPKQQEEQVYGQKTTGQKTTENGNPGQKTTRKKRPLRQKTTGVEIL